MLKQNLLIIKNQMLHLFSQYKIADIKKMVLNNIYNE